MNLPQRGCGNFKNHCHCKNLRGKFDRSFYCSWRQSYWLIPKRRWHVHRAFLFGNRWSAYKDLRALRFCLILGMGRLKSDLICLRIYLLYSQGGSFAIEFIDCSDHVMEKWTKSPSNQVKQPKFFWDFNHLHRWSTSLTRGHFHNHILL